MLNIICLKVKDHCAEKRCDILTQHFETVCCVNYILCFLRKKENTSSSTTQELVVGSSAGMETKSTPVAAPTSLLTTIQPADASTHPLPATRDKAKSKCGTKMFRRVRTMFRRNEK